MQSESPKQLELNFADDTIVSTPKNVSSQFEDPAFSVNKALPVHRWVPWVAGFSADFVRGALNHYVKPGAHVLDPFAGVGTTLVEAVLSGCNATGFEINPYAALASRTKTYSYRVPVELFQQEIARFREFFLDNLRSSYELKNVPPPSFKTRAYFYSPLVLRKVLIVQDFIDSIEHADLKNLFRVAFASTMVSYSNYSYEPSLGRRVSAGKSEIEDYAVEQTIVAKLMQMVKDIVWFKAMIPDGINPRTTVVNDSFFEFENYVSPGTVDLIVTSPPYLNNYHYNRNTRPHLYWLGYVENPGDFKPLEEGNFGKYWQTVRTLEKIDLKFSIDGSDIYERLETIRGLNPEKGVYGGSGWANYAASYFNDSYDFALAVNSVLRPGGTALVVIGNSILQGVLMPTDQYFGQIAELAGLELVGIEVPRATRVGNSIIQSDVRVAKAKKKHTLYEAVVILKKS